MKIASGVCKWFLVVVSLILMVQGIRWGFFPASNLADNEITATSPLALNMIKSDIGGGLIAASVLIGLFALKGNQWFFPAAVITAAYLVVRTLSWLVDGTHPMIVSGVVLEAIVLAALFFLKRARDQSLSKTGASQTRLS